MGQESGGYFRSALSLAWVLSCACSTIYHVESEDLERVKHGQQISNLKDERGAPVDFTHYHFVYSEAGQQVPREVKGIESLNVLSGSGQLAGLETLRATPQRGDKAWQRTVLGGGVGLATGLGVGFAVSNRVLIERSAREGAACTTCGPGYVALGTIVSGVIGAAVGSVVAYFAGAGVGSSRTGLLEFFSEPSSEPTSAPGPERE